MSLTVDDLKAIRMLIREEVRPIVREEFKDLIKPVEGKLTAIENDIKEIYDIFEYHGFSVVLD